MKHISELKAVIDENRGAIITYCGREGEIRHADYERRFLAVWYVRGSAVFCVRLSERATVVTDQEDGIVIQDPHMGRVQITRQAIEIDESTCCDVLWERTPFPPLEVESTLCDY